jgi:hypothetical protein
MSSEPPDELTAVSKTAVGVARVRADDSAPYDTHVDERKGAGLGPGMP